jgi:hypothetical protein
MKPGNTCCAQWGHKLLPGVMGYPPSGHGWTITSRPGPGPASSAPHVPTRDVGQSRPCRPASRQRSPARPHAGRGVPGRHAPATRRRRVPARAASPPHGPEGGRRGPGASVPQSRRGRRDRRGHGARCKAVPARGAGCGPRADSERGAGPPGRPDNALREVKPAACEDQSKRNNGWGRGVARDAATGLEKRRRGQAQRWRTFPHCKCSLQLYNGGARYPV